MYTPWSLRIRKIWLHNDVVRQCLWLSLLLLKRIVLGYGSINKQTLSKLTIHIIWKLIVIVTVFGVWWRCNWFHAGTCVGGGLWWLNRGAGVCSFWRFWWWRKNCNSDKIINLRKEKSSFAYGKKQPRSYWSCSSMEIKYASTRTPPSARTQFLFQMSTPSRPWF